MASGTVQPRGSTDLASTAERILRTQFRIAQSVLEHRSEAVGCCLVYEPSQGAFGVGTGCVDKQSRHWLSPGCAVDPLA